MDKPSRIIISSKQSNRAASLPGAFIFSAKDIPVGTSSKYRQDAWDIYARLAFPSVGDDAWRRTDLRSLPADQFHLPSPGDKRDLPPVPKGLQKPLVSSRHGGRVILTPWGTQAELDPQLERMGVIFTDLVTAEIKHPELVKAMAGQIVRAEEGKFAALASTLAQTGIVLYVPKGINIAQPLQSIHWSPGADLAHISHILVWVDEGASVTYSHESSSPNQKATSLNTGIVEIRVGSGANLQFIEMQTLGNNAWNFGHERIRVEKNGNLEWVIGAVGSRLTKNFSEVDLVGEGATAKVSGFYFTDGDQHLDYDTQQNHLVPNTSSDLLFKGALCGKSRSIWQGMIYVAPGAQKTDGYQANRNLVLSSDSRADSIPGLEILADDVRCTHGATVGKLDDEPLFYLQSRGIPRQVAEQMLVEGFFDPIMQRIPFPGVRERFQQVISRKMRTARN